MSAILITFLCQTVTCHDNTTIDICSYIIMQMYDRERSVLSVFNNTFGTDLRPLTEVDNV